MPGSSKATPPGLAQIEVLQLKARLVIETCTDTPYGMNFLCTGTDVSPMHFTGKQKDTETGNDYFGARYLASGTNLGRFMTPDWASDGSPVPYAKLDNPQTLNLYAYLRNNPLNNVDPDGHGPPNTAQPCTDTTKCDTGLKQENNNPTTQEVKSELTKLADDYGVPAPVMLAVAQTESNFDVDAVNDNKNRKGEVTSTDYGVMQVNSGNIKGTVTGADGKAFTITDSIKTDWKDNANAGAAIVAQEYKAAVKAQPNGTAESQAQQTYSGYNAGPKGRDRYTNKDKNGDFADRRDKHFLSNYRLQAQ